MQLAYNGKAPRTWFDGFDKKTRNIEKREEQFDEEEAVLRDAATERGRKRVPGVVRKSMDGEFARLRYNPYDIKALLNPVDFLVFNGLNDKEKLTDITFLSKRTEDKELIRIRRSIESVINEGNYIWQVARVDIAGKIHFEI